MGSFKQQKDDDELYALLRPGRDIYLKIAEVMNNTNHASVILLIENMSYHADTRIELLRYLKSNEYEGVYVTLNTPIANLIDIFEKSSINIENIYFIDGITKTTESEIIESEHCRYLESPRDVVDLSFLIDEFLNKIKHPKRFVVIDSISTLMVYNSEQAIKQFAHSVTGKIKSKKASGVIIASDDTDKDALNSIAHFCDKTLKLSN
ncbi:MAG: ATPase domain-containing protein [Candidatus Diapherotrites archaeon]